MRSDQAVKLTIPNILGYERFAMSCSATYAKRLGFKPERIEDIKTAVAEACVNAIQHGNKEKPEESVVVKLRQTSKHFAVAVVDHGNGFDNPCPKDPDIDRIIKALDPPKGFGLFLINKLVDTVELNQKIGDGHFVELFFRLP